MHPSIPVTFKNEGYAKYKFTLIHTQTHTYIPVVFSFLIFEIVVLHTNKHTNVHAIHIYKYVI